MDYTMLLHEAIQKIKELSPGKTFVLRDLFQGAYWNSLEKKVRLEFGRRFKHAVLIGEVANVVYIGKAENNSALYQKKENIDNV